MKFVIDANVLVSAALFRDSIPALALKKVLNTGELIMSHETLEELKRTLNKTKLQKYLTAKDKFSFLTKLENLALIITITQTVSICRDSKDNAYLELALSGEADLIITGDSDLLILHPFRDIPIIMPADFLRRT